MSKNQTRNEAVFTMPIAELQSRAEKAKALFAQLEDRGVDPKRFETELLRDHLARRAILGGLLAEAEAIAAPLGDTVLTLGEAVRPVLLAAYQIAKPISTAADRLRSGLAPALDSYGRIGRRSAESRAKKPEPLSK